MEPEYKFDGDEWAKKDNPKENPYEGDRVVTDQSQYWSDAKDDLEWERSIELKLSTQGKMIIGLGAGVLITLALTGLQGKVVVRLVNANKMVVEAINALSSAINDGAVGNANPNIPYNQPEKKVDTPEPNQEELDELRQRMEESARADIPSYLDNEGDIFNG